MSNLVRLTEIMFKGTLNRLAQAKK